MKVLCEVSVRHVHLSEEDLQALFGRGELTPLKPLSQPGQYLCEERVNLVTPKGTLQNVAIIGPTRERTQVELSMTDCFTLGLKGVPILESGNHEGSVGIVLQHGAAAVELQRGVIIAKRHVHLDPGSATAGGFSDGQVVTVRFEGVRGGSLDNIVVRVGENFAPAVHIDSDEANAMGFARGEVSLLG